MFMTLKKTAKGFVVHQNGKRIGHAFGVGYDKKSAALAGACERLLPGLGFSRFAGVGIASLITAMKEQGYELIQREGISDKVTVWEIVVKRTPLVINFEPKAIREHFDNGENVVQRLAVQKLTDSELWEIGQNALDITFNDYHRNVSDALRDFLHVKQMEKQNG